MSKFTIWESHLDTGYRNVQIGTAKDIESAHEFATTHLTMKDMSIEVHDKHGRVLQYMVRRHRF